MKSTDNIKQNAASDQSMRNLSPKRSQKPPQGQALEASDGLIKGTIGRKGGNRGEDLARLSQFLYEAAAPLSLVADLMNPEKNGDLIERYQSEVLGYKNPDGRIDPGGSTLQAIKSLRGQETVMSWYVTSQIEDQTEKEAEAGPKKERTSSLSLVLMGSVGRDGKNNPEDLKTLAAFLSQAQAPGLLIAGLINPAYNGDVIEKYQREVLGFRSPDGLIEPGGKTLKAIRRMQGREVVAGWFGVKNQEEETHIPSGAAFPNLELDVKQYWETQKAGKCDQGALTMVNSHKKEHPELYEDFGSIGANKTTVANSFHLVWEKDWEKGAKREEGDKSANDVTTLEKDGEEWDMAIRYAFACIKSGVPVLLALNHTYAYKNALGNNDKTTDHWAPAIGIGSDEKGNYISYTDPGTTRRHVGIDTELNRLYQTEDPHIWRDETKYANADAGSGSYTLVGITLYNEHRGKNEFKVGNQTFVRKRKF